MVRYFLPAALMLVLAAPAGAQGIKTGIGIGCAPWNAPTLDIRHITPRFEVSARIWLQGYEALLHGEKEILINNKTVYPGVTDATGEATVLQLSSKEWSSSAEYNITVRFSTLELRDGGKAEGVIVGPLAEPLPFRATVRTKHACDAS